MSIFLWLDDVRKPPTHADTGVVWTWVKNYEDTIKQLESGQVIFASLDHDLADEHYQAYFRAMEAGEPVDTDGCKEKTGYDVLCWLEEHQVWPEKGVRIHTMNAVRFPIMLNVVKQYYGRTFQYNFPVDITDESCENG